MRGIDRLVAGPACRRPSKARADFTPYHASCASVLLLVSSARCDPHSQKAPPATANTERFFCFCPPLMHAGSAAPLHKPAVRVYASVDLDGRPKSGEKYPVQRFPWSKEKFFLISFFFAPLIFLLRSVSRSAYVNLAKAPRGLNYQNGAHFLSSRSVSGRSEASGSR